jgi:hypothetical protein
MPQALSLKLLVEEAERVVQELAPHDQQIQLHRKILFKQLKSIMAFCQLLKGWVKIKVAL